MSDIEHGNNHNDGYNSGYNDNQNPSYNPQQNFRQTDIPMHPEHEPGYYQQNTNLTQQPADPFVQPQVQPQQGQEWYSPQQNQISQEQTWYNQGQNLTPQEQNWYNQPQQNEMDNMVEDLEQIYIARQLKANNQDPQRVKKKKEKQQKPKKKFRLSFTGFVLLLITVAIIFFTAQYFINESFLDKHLPDEPFQYTVETNYKDYITDDIILPDILGDEETSYEIVWESSHPEILNEKGEVNRPADKNQTVTLTMKLKKGFWYSQRKFEVIVIKSSAINVEDVFVLTNEMINNGISTNEFIITYKEDGSIYSVDGNFNNTLIESEQDALSVIDAYRDLLNIQSDVSFVLENVSTSLIGKTYSFYPQKNGISVVGQGIVISTKNDYLRNITTTVTEIVSEDLKELTEDELTTIAGNYLSVEVNILSSKTVIYDNNLVCEVIVYEPNGNGDLTCLIIDVSSKEVLSQEPVVFSYTEITGTGIDEIGKKQTFPVVEEKSLLSTKYKLMDAKRGIIIVDGHDYTWDKVLNDTSYKVITNNKNEWNKYPMGISALKNFATVYDWWKTNFGYTSYDGKGKTIYCFINAQEILASQHGNAAYNPYGITSFLAGDKSEKNNFAPMAKLEVTAHEFTHGIFDHIAKHTFSDKVMASSIDEGYADIFGCLIEGDWIIGDGVMVGYEARRDPTNTIDKLPSTFPEKYYDENWSTDGHLNSILLSRAAYQMTQQGFSDMDVARIWFQSMCYGYYDGDDFLTVRNHVEQAARALGYTEEQITIIGDIFGAMDIGEMATRKIESYSVEGDRVKDNTTERTYIVVLSPLGTVFANTPIWIFEEDTNVGTTATDAQMSEFLSSYASSYMNSMTEDMTWNITVDYRKYSPWAIDILSRYIDDAKQGLLGNISEASGMEKEDANVLLSMAFLTFKFEGTAYEFFSEILELDYSRLIVEEDGTISYDFT